MKGEMVQKRDSLHFLPALFSSRASHPAQDCSATVPLTSVKVSQQEL